jgi:hypothetical protein
LTASTQLTGVAVAESRRGRGEGSFYSRKDGRWVGQYEVVGKRRYVYRKTHKVAAGRLAKAVAEGNDGFIVDSENFTLARYLDLWLERLEPRIMASASAYVGLIAPWRSAQP